VRQSSPERAMAVAASQIPVKRCGSRSPWLGVRLRGRTRRWSGASKQRKPARKVKMAMGSLSGSPIETEGRKGESGEEEGGSDMLPPGEGGGGRQPYHMVVRGGGGRAGEQGRAAGCG
jgi:hypothetical protein